MGQRHHQLVSFLCGAFKKKQPPDPSAANNNQHSEDDLASSSLSPPVKPPSPGGSDGPADDHQPLPPPPGALHMRAASCHHHQRSNSAASKLVSSVSMRVLGSGAGRQSSRREHKEKKLKQEDSIWKKTIILGEKCRVPDEDEESILYDEKGNRISTFHHRKSVSGAASFSRQTLCIDPDELSKK